MKALTLAAPGQLEYGDVSTIEPCAGEVLVEVRACGICGSDVHGLDGSTGRRRPSLVMGHESAGVIARLGLGVSGWSEGTRVTFDSTISCGRCRLCLIGQVNLCDEKQVLGVSCEDYLKDGAFAEYVAVPARVLYHLPEDLNFERAVLLEPLSIAVHAVKRAGILADDTTVVVGTGMVGLLIVQVLRAYGCQRVIGVDIDPGRLVAAATAAEHLLAGDAEAVAEAVFERTGGVGADIAIEVVGVSASVETAIGSVRKGGRVSLVGNLSPRVELPLQASVTRELTIFGSCASAGEYPECIDLLSSGKVDVDPVISAVVPLAEGAEWFQRLRSGSSGLMKVMLKPTEGI